MTKYEELLEETEDAGLNVKERPLQGNDGRIYKNRIAIRSNIETEKEKACVLAEELGHHHTSIGNILNLTDISNRKQEQRARLWGYNKLIGLNGLISAYQAGCQNRHDAAELLNVTEEYLQECINCYRGKYGVCVELDNYIIYFFPHLAVMEKV